MRKGCMRTGHPRFGRKTLATAVLQRMSLGVWLILAAGLSQPARAAAPYLGVASQGVAEKGAALSGTCAACHGAHGNSVSVTFPNLAGQSYNYLLKELENFRSGARKATPMSTMIKTVPQAPGDQNLKNLAAYFAASKLNRQAGANATEAKPSKSVASAGYRIYAEGDAAEKVPACDACHMPSGLGNAPMAIPALAGQHASYVATELKRFASGKRHNSPEHIMQAIAKRLTAKQIKAVAAYVQELRPRLVAGTGPRSYQAYVKAASHQPVPGIPASALSAGKTDGSADGGQG